MNKLFDDTLKHDDLAWITHLPLEQLGDALGFNEDLSRHGLKQPNDLREWKMEIGDQPIFRYLYRNLQPKRHLEFGTWEGEGLCYCLEECQATAWTINLLEGETRENGEWAYGTTFSDQEAPTQWAEKLESRDKNQPITWYRTDAYGFIGHHYRRKNFGPRVNQIYCDSTLWDCSQYPDNFFDTALIDGGHQTCVVISDTQKALSVVRSGGIILWHDFCPIVAFDGNNPVVDGVSTAINKLRQELEEKLDCIYWIEPSYILIGRKK